ncbi:glycoside hydrolase family 2 TIM barrel-domain containing protein [Asticcacaulis sp. BYS171W]|uniref:Beta-glucuronidase n=1 Tax=Asticcacaulis aquaticus TaxID=2984212 RepID=A0ABT5HXC3_9CAUL|nr:glycoside hydrolase family 2 TIM barrel-domain containing protein [Asticcacaulis aquaticus]MDC7684678.1 glycoside hydrolase family 2 TIM barrel-domain containing protein [Asticcacaulis aquaticus]
MPLLSRLIAAVIGLCLMSAAPVMAQNAASDLRPKYLLTGAIDRENDDLSGQWTYSKDLYRTGLTDINGWVAKSRMQRYRDLDVAAEEAKGGATFFEFDMDRGPQMSIPGAWNAAEPELRYYDGLIWFQRKFTPKALSGKRAFLRFEAVNYRAYIYLNGKEIGRHEGGFTPFVFEVTDALKAGENRLTVGVDSKHDGKTIPTEITDWDLYGGITRPVRLIYTPQTFVDDATATLTTQGRITGSVQLNGANAAGQAVTFAVAGAGIKVSATTDATGYAAFDVKAPKGLKLWSPESPTLYDVTFSAAGDTLKDRMGFRTIAVKGEQILLNGKPIFLRGISLHEEEFGTNPARRITPQAARALLSEIKYGLHGNYVRLSHYPHSEVTVRLADEMGLLVWSEIPVYWTVDWENPEALAKVKHMQAETIYRDRNRASVILWSVGNETPISEPRTKFHNAMADNARALDPTRLISAALLVERKTIDGHVVIAIDDPLVDKLDVMAVNTYAGWYGDDKLDALPDMRWTAPQKKPIVLSEFGADALAGYHAVGEPKKFSEEYQAEYYRKTLEMADKIPGLQGMSPWILKDFQSPRREHPIYQNGWNRKGLLSETGEHKLAFEVLADYYVRKAADTAK